MTACSSSARIVPPMGILIMPCTPAKHAAIKNDPIRVKTETTSLGAQSVDGVVIGYMRNCSLCRSTLMLTPEQHAVVLAREETTNGVG